MVIVLNKYIIIVRKDELSNPYQSIMRQLYELVGNKYPTKMREDGGGGGVDTSKYELLGLFPGVRWVAEVTIGRSLAINWLLKIEFLHNDTGPKIPILPDNLDELQISFLACAICVDKDRQRLGDTNGVRELDERTTSEASGNQGLGWRNVRMK